MLRKVFDNKEQNNSTFINMLSSLFSFAYYCYYHFFADQYVLQLNNFHYCDKQKDYVLNLRFRNKGYVLTANAQEIFSDKVVFQFISSIDAYIIGILYGLSRNKIIYTESEIFLNYFRKYNTPQVTKPMILITERKYIGGNAEIFLKLKNADNTIKATWRELAKKPYLIQSLNTTDATTLGVLSADGFANELCQAL